jgi:hypothetical protein
MTFVSKNSCEKNMHFLITGGTGLIGSALCDEIQSLGHDVYVWSRDANKVHKTCGASVIAIESLEQIGDNEDIDVVINLAGAPIANLPWTARRKRVLEKSRIDLTEQLVDWIRTRKVKPKTLISGSAIGWYGDQADTNLTEASLAHDEYTAELCEKWEQAALKAEDLGIRVCIVRTGLVLANKGGFLARMLAPFKLGLGGPIGHGQQYMSWIHLSDMLNILLSLAQNTSYKGIYNATSPEPVTNETFTFTLGRILNRPTRCRLPAWLLKCTMGEMSILLLGSQRVLPERLLAQGFQFQYTQLDAALEDVLAQQ